MHSVDFRLGGGNHLRERHSVHYGRDGDEAFAVFTLDCRRSEAFHHLSEFFQAHRLACGGIDDYVLDVGDFGAVIGVVHHLDVIFLAVFAELRSGGAVDAVAQIVGHCLHVQSVKGKLLAIE